MHLLLLAAALLATPPAADPFALPVEERLLPNGLRLILARDAAVPGVAVSVRFEVGSADEAPGRTGLAHLFEHLMFMGSTHAPYPAFDERMERRGGVNNASTENDATGYYEVGPASLLPVFLWLEADRLWTLPETMTAEKVKAQRLVVQNERRQSYENRPYAGAWLALPAALFPPGHPYAWPVIGSHADLEAASDEDVKAFFRRHYLPSNASLAIVGDFDPAEAAALVERYFGWMPAGERPVRALVPPPGPARQAQVRLEDAVALPKAMLAWRAPPRCTPGDAALELAVRMLVSGSGGRIHQPLVYERRIASKVEAELQSLRLGGILVVGAVAQPGHGSAELAAALEEAVGRLAAEGPTDAELRAAKAVVLTELAAQLEGLVTRAQQLQYAGACTGSAGALPRLARLYREASAADVRSALAAMLAGDRVLISIEPRAGEGRR